MLCGLSLSFSLFWGTPGRRPPEPPARLSGLVAFLASLSTGLGAWGRGAAAGVLRFLLSFLPGVSGTHSALGGGGPAAGGAHTTSALGTPPHPS